MKTQRGIYQWLYDKIILLEKIEEDMVQWAEAQGLPAKEWMQNIIQEYGKPTEGKPLEKAADKNNIARWLFDRVQGIELRQAALITGILEEKPEFEEGLMKIVAQHGETAAKEYQGLAPRTPEEIYIILNDYILEGMPNERVNDILSGSENVIIWRTNKCLHKPYWDAIGGEINHFYDLRETWVRSFIETLTPDFTYERRPNGDHKIVRR